MSFEELLVNTVDVYRPTITKDHGRSTKSYPDDPTVSDVICNIQFNTGQSGRSAGSLNPTQHGYETVEGYIGFFEYGADIQEDDKIVDEKGRSFIIQTSPEDVSGRDHHIETVLSIVE